MTDALPTIETEPTALALACARTRRQIERLERMAEIGMEMTEEAARGAVAPEGASPPTSDPTRTFNRITRSVRMTMALQAKLLKDLVAFEQARGRELQEQQADDAATEERAHKARFDERCDLVESVVHRAVQAEKRERFEFERLTAEADERLRYIEVDDLLSRPAGAIVERICEDLGLSPDWRAWAQEPWAQEEAAAGDPASPFIRLTAEPAQIAEPPPDLEFSPQGGSP